MRLLGTGLAALGAALAFALVMPVGYALAAQPVSPPNGTIVREDENVVARWTLDASRQEEAFAIYWASRPDRGADGGFSGFYDLDFLAPQQTSYLFSRPAPGRYYWYIESYGCSEPPDEFGFCFQDFVAGPTAFFGVLDLISVSEAKRYTRKVIRRGKRDYLNISKLKCRVKTDFKARCKFRAWIGDVSYKGKGILFYSSDDFEDNVDDFHWRYRVRYTNHYCLAVEDKSRAKCTDKKRWRG